MPQITMLENVWNGATLLAAGSAVTVSTELADMLVGARKAVDSSGYQGARVDQTMADDVQRAHAAAVVGAAGIHDAIAPGIDAGGTDRQKILTDDGIGDIVIPFDSGAGWAANGTGTPTLTQDFTGFDSAGARTGVVSQTGAPAMLKVVPGTANDEIQSTTFAAATTGGKFGLWVYLANQPGYEAGGTIPSGGSAAKFSLLLSTDAVSFSNALTVTFDHLYIREGWNFLVYNELASTSRGGPGHPTGITRVLNGTGVNGDIVANTIKRAKIIFTNLNGGPELYFDSMWANFTTRPRFVIGTDAQGSDLATIMLPLMQRYGWERKTYMAVPRQVLDAGDTTSYYYKTWSVAKPNIQSAYDAGMICCPHSTNHQRPGALTDAGRVRWEVLPVQAWLASNGWTRGNEIWVSPNFSTSRLSERVIKDMGFIGQRHGRGWCCVVSPFGIDNPQHIGSIDMGLTTNQTYTIIKSYIDIAVAYGGTVWLFHHSIQTLGDPGTGEGTTGNDLLIYKSNYENVMAYIKSLEIAGSADVISPFEFFLGYEK
jgi:hypothetical protein